MSTLPFSVRIKMDQLEPAPSGHGLELPSREDGVESPTPSMKEGLEKIEEEVSGNILTEKGRKALHLLLRIGTATSLYPFRYDAIEHQLYTSRWRTKVVFAVHKAANFFIMVFSLARLIQAFVRGGFFPLPLKILNIVFFAAYVLTFLALMQMETKEREILQFYNVLLKHIFQEEIDENMRQIKKKKDASDPTPSPRRKSKPHIHALKGNKSISFDASYLDEERKTAKKITACFIFAMILLAANPSVHVKLVEESPCTPSFLISAYYQGCETFSKLNITIWDKLPWMTPEYYFTTIMFTSWSFNWAAIFLGMSWMILRLKRMANGLTHRNDVQISNFRQIEVLAKMMNDGFVLYLSTFPNLLFAIVSILLFGIIRIWGSDPTSNLMFPLCGIRCTFEAVSPLEIAGQVNEKNKDLLRIWKKDVSRKKRTHLWRSYIRSFNGVRCNAGSLYTFENTIVLTCLNNCIMLTFNMLLTFKKHV